MSNQHEGLDAKKSVIGITWHDRHKKLEKCGFFEGKREQLC
jgi:hypothetical protein